MFISSKACIEILPELFFTLQRHGSNCRPGSHLNLSHHLLITLYNLQKSSTCRYMYNSPMRSVLFVSVKLSNVYRGLCMDGSQSHSISNSVFISFFSFFSSYFSSFIHSTSSKIIWENGVPRARSDWRDKPIPRRCTEIIDSTYGNFRVVPSA